MAVQIIKIQHNNIKSDSFFIRSTTIKNNINDLSKSDSIKLFTFRDGLKKTLKKQIITRIKVNQNIFDFTKFDLTSDGELIME